MKLINICMTSLFPISKEFRCTHCFYLINRKHVKFIFSLRKVSDVVFSKESWLLDISKNKVSQIKYEAL